MEENKSHIEILIARKMAGEISEEEFSQLMAWIRESEENKKIYSRIVTWTGHHWADHSRERVWKRVEVVTRRVPSGGKEGIRRLTRQFWRVAALFFLILLLPFFPAKFNKGQQGHNVMNTVVGNDLTTSFFLPDGSWVTLFRGSSLTYPKNFSCIQNEVELKGKAYFEVSGKCEKPMLIRTGDKCTLISKGDVNVDFTENKVDVAVRKGFAAFGDTSMARVVLPMIKLRPAYPKNHVPQSTLKNVFISSNESFSYHISTGLINFSKSDECEVFAWKDRIFCLNNSNILQVVRKISEWYGVQVIINGEVNPDDRFTGSFFDESIENLSAHLFNNQFYRWNYYGGKLLITRL